MYSLQKHPQGLHAKKSAYDKYLSMAIEYKLDLSRQYFVNQVLINACHLRNPDLSYMRNDINRLCYTFIFCFTYYLSIQSHSDRWVYRVFSFNLCLLVEMFNVKEEKILEWRSFGWRVIPLEKFRD